ncbi:hypothetical protein [Psychrobacter sp.]|uniref:hypothetical protein n=1 Tax=Psychrobacter sp. TaxID=56811 RepID=UPI0025D3AFCB|nr:hypothetical protein [Psychrobacter sp.]
MKQTDRKLSASDPKYNKSKSTKGLSRKQSQWAWFIGLYLAGLITITAIAKLIKMAMGI